MCRHRFCALQIEGLELDAGKLLKTKTQDEENIKELEGMQYIPDEDFPDPNQKRLLSENLGDFAKSMLDGAPKAPIGGNILAPKFLGRLGRLVANRIEKTKKKVVSLSLHSPPFVRGMSVGACGRVGRMGVWLSARLSSTLALISFSPSLFRLPQASWWSTFRTVHGKKPKKDSWWTSPSKEKKAPSARS